MLIIGLAGCTSAGSATSAGEPNPAVGSVPVSTTTGGSVRYPSRCVAADREELPDPVCTPGAVNPAVTPATLRQTICRSGWSATVRPPLSYTSRVKRAAIAAYGDYAGSAMGGYELDHLVSLALGGAPWDVRNLWPEHPASTNPKDGVENAAHRAVCNGTLSLTAAQRGIATDWITLGHRLGVSGLPAS